MLWDEVSQTQGYRWIDVLPAFVIAYNKAPHETHKKSPYEAFFGFKMRGVYGTPSEILIESNQVEESLQDTIDDATDHTESCEITDDTNQVNVDYQQTAYENHLKQVQQVRREIVRNDENYRNKMLVRASVHRRKPAFNPGDKVAIAPDHDNNQKTRKRKLEQPCSVTGEVISMCSNNRTVRIEVNGQVKTFAAKNVKKLSS